MIIDNIPKKAVEIKKIVNRIMLIKLVLGGEN